tara:strand:- start:68 stop:658 length:591 start_codon:yes stop_codon:yes gene_type:complete
MSQIQTLVYKENKLNIKNGFGMAKSFLTAMASRGFSNNKTDPYVKKLRVVSCFGNVHAGGILPPCEHLSESQTKGKYFCGGCGCGDRKATWLIAESDEYSKLDYPKLECPLNMPGFSNYKESRPEEGISPVSRRYFIENINQEEIEKTNVTTYEVPAEILKIEEAALLHQEKEKEKNKIPKELKEKIEKVFGKQPE